MLNLDTKTFSCSLPFQTYLLGDRKVKDLLHKFDFYNISFMMSEHSATKIHVQFPIANLYWYVDFEKEVKELFKRDSKFRKDWLKLLDFLKKNVQKQFLDFRKYIEESVRENVPNTIDRYGFFGPRSYQAYDAETLIAKMTYEWKKCKTGLILSEQRTGKTRVALAVADRMMPDGSTVVIVAPKSACFGWATEATELNTYIDETVFHIVAVKHASQLSETKPLSASEKGINLRIISYELFKILSEKQWMRLVSPHSKQVMLIGDEVHRMRNFKTQQSKAIHNFKTMCLKKKLELSIVGTTGTPAVKHGSDIFGLLSMVNTSRIALEPYWKNWDCFCEYFYNCYDSEFGKQVLTSRRDAEMNFLLQCVAVQTKQADLEIFKGYDIKYLKRELGMDPEQTLAYNELVEKMQFEDVDCKNGLVQLLRLQQVCVDPSALFASYAALAPKIIAALDIIDRAKGQGLVMSKYVAPLVHLKNVCLEHGISCELLTGSVSAADRAKIIEQFNTEHTYKVLLIQLDVGKEALTLPAAAYTLFLDRNYTPGVNAQAEMRMAPVDGTPCTKYVVDLVMKGTVEERIHNILVIRKTAIRSVNSVFESERKEDTL